MKTPVQKALDKEVRAAKKLMAREAFFRALVANGLPLPGWEVRFHDERGWRLDYAWEAERVALEVDGGLYVNGGHNRGAYMEEMHQKFNEAATLGWRVLRTVPKKLTNSDTLDVIRRALKAA